MRLEAALLLLANMSASLADARNLATPQRLPVAGLIGLTPAQVGERLGGVLIPGSAPPVDSA